MTVRGSVPLAGRARAAGWRGRGEGRRHDAKRRRRPGHEGRVDDGIRAEFRESFAVLANLGFVREQ
jgi:hypothetical protein